MGTREFRKTYPEWIGHNADIRAGAQTPEDWMGLMIDVLLWKRLGMLTTDDTDNCTIFHQIVAEHLERYHIPVIKRKKWIVCLTVALLCGTVAVGYQQYTQRQAAEEEIRSVLELGAAGYGEYGRLYVLLQNLANNAVHGDTDSFLITYDTALSELKAEQEQTKSEERDAARIAQSKVYDQLQLNWGEKNTAYEHTILSDLFAYPDQRAAFYAEKLPYLKLWTESELLREKSPEFGDAFLALLEADANVAAETYHIAVGIHLPTGKGQALWVEKIQDAVALADELDEHRNKDYEEDRSSRLSFLHTRYLDAEFRFEEELSRLKGYIQNYSREK